LLGGQRQAHPRDQNHRAQFNGQGLGTSINGRSRSCQIGPTGYNMTACERICSFSSVR
jgi:hypothetical protein